MIPVREIARLAHEINRAYCSAQLSDTSQVPWDEAPAWQQESAIAGVRAILAGEVQTPEQSHEGWRTLKIVEGWSWGPVKDPEAKKHPCMLPYEELPPEQRVKDRLFFAVVRTFSDDLEGWL